MPGRCGKRHMKKVKAIKCEIWDRTVGYYQSTANLNPGKKAEQLDRKRYNISNMGKEKNDN